jgi:FkbM family methyltransferase
MLSKIANNIIIYKDDIKTKGVYWSIVHRLYKLPKGRLILTPIVNALKPNFLIIQDHKFYIDKSDTTISQELILSGKWEEYETELFKKYAKKDDVVLDIGAHIGYYTLIAARIVGDKGKVYAFEPDPKNFKILKRNVEENGYKNIILVNKALSNKSGRIKLFINKENTGDHRIYDLKNEREFISIQAITLDDFFKKRAKKVDLIKMDIQGAEVRAFKGGNRLIKENMSIKILTEFWPHGLELSGSSAKEYCLLLKKNKFTIYNVDETEKNTKLINLNELLMPIQSETHDYRYLLCIKKE